MASRDPSPMATIPPDDIDRLAEAEGWFRPELDRPPFTTILDHLAGTRSLADTVARLTAPVNHAFSTGRCDEAPRGDADGPTAEGQLWELWYAVLHAAKRQAWRADPDDAHGRLAALLDGLLRAPDPPLPAPATHAIRHHWVWRGGALWSGATLLGPASREMWNDSPGCGAGYAPAAVAAWANVNAFVARLTRDGVRGYALYALWAMRDALEEQDDWAFKLDAAVPAAAAWVALWGPAMWARREDLTPDDSRSGNPGQPGDLMIQRTGSRRPVWSRERWDFWKLRFHEISVRDKVTDETKALAREAFDRMDEIERSSTTQ